MNFIFLGIVVFLTVYGFLWLMANVQSKTFSSFFRFSTIIISIIAIIFLFFVGRYLLSLPFFALIFSALKKKVFNIFNIVYLYRLFSSKNQSSFNQFKQSNTSSMDAAEAYEVLGLTKNCSRKDILQAHKKLILSLHPDKSGNNYLAGKINQARDTLLKLHK
jgi:DNA-directed RNA polymerase subunit N (RpoN/RPB10)